ncbi:ABC transporter substrate-binding protein [Treponema sp.]|uniref:ABC transporter substrate-binding protein n=1 Tax=Treponema sp. TaxID=166 RepID=UPI003F0834A5
MKKITFLISFAFAVIASGFSQKIGVLKGPSGIPSAYLMEHFSADYKLFSGANFLLPGLIKGEVDIAFLPPNVAAKAYNAGGGAVVMAGVCGNGMVSLVTKDSSVKNLADLKGREIFVAGQGATPDFMMRYILKQNGISFDGASDNVRLSYSLPAAEIAPALILGKIQYAVLPEPFSTLACEKDSAVFRAVDFQAEFKTLSGLESFPMTVIAVNSGFAKSQPEKVRKFLERYKEAQEWTLSNPGEAGVLVEKFQLGLNRQVVEKAIPECAFVFETGESARRGVESLLLVFMEFDPSSVGGKLPDGGFYFE